MFRSFRGRVLTAYLLAVGAVILLLLTGDSTVVAIIAAVLVVTGAAVLFGAVSRVARFARMTAGASREFGEGGLTARTDWASADELGDVSDEFNRMASRLERRVNAAAQERARLLAALNSSVDGIVAVDAHNTITFSNTAVRDLLGRDPEEMTGETFAWLMSDPAVVRALRECNASRARSSHVVERPGRHYVRAIITPIQGGGEWASLVVFHDLTDVRRTELVRRDFVANVSHELRTPLAAVRSVIETLQRGAIDDRPAAMDFLRRADEEVDRLVQMVEELLELSRVESGQLRLAANGIDMSAIATSAVDRLRPPALLSDVELTLETAPDLPPVRGDMTALERAAVNLVHNAIKFTPEGGRVAITVRPVGGGVEFAVTDTGVGIDEDDLPRVFERFYKADRARRAGGTGLGLALVKHTVEAHGGRVEARSEAGHGATFTMWLPTTAAETLPPVRCFRHRQAPVE
jgi:two-component system phosphate regulon sensor histidine kinase PhoR